MTDQTVPFSPARRVPVDMAGARIHDLPWPVVVYFIAVVVPISVDVGPLFVTLLRVVLMALVIPLTVQLMSGRHGRLVATDWLFMAFVVWMTLSVGVNNPTRMVEYTGSVGLEFFGGYVVGRVCVRTPQTFMALARLLVLFLLLTLPLAIFESLTGVAMLLETLRSLPGVSTHPDNIMSQRMGLWRAQLVFAHPIHYGLFATIAFSLAFVGLKGQTTTVWRYVSSGLIAACVILSVSSGAVLALVLQFMLILWAAIFAGMRRRWHLLAGIAAAGYVTIDLLSNRTPFDVFLTYATFNSATAFWRSTILDWGLKNVWGSPIFGIGLNDWVRPWFMRQASVDNFWLLAAMRFGIPGFLLLVAGYAIGLARVMRRDFSTDPMLRQLRLAWVFTFLGLTFTLATVAIWTNVYSFVFFMFASGFWLMEVQPAGTPAAATPRGRAPRRAPATLPVSGLAGFGLSGRPILADARDPAPDPAPDPALDTAPDMASGTALSGPRYTRFPAAADRARPAGGGRFAKG